MNVLSGKMRRIEINFCENKILWSLSKCPDMPLGHVSVDLLLSIAKLEPVALVGSPKIVQASGLPLCIA